MPMTDYTRVIIPDSGQDLLRHEVAYAFSQLGLEVVRAHPSDLYREDTAHFLPTLLQQGKTLLFSINFMGLQSLKFIWHHMTANKGHIAVWCVDNPWNILAGVRDPLWKKLSLFITDASFITALRRHGAQCVHALPLAASPTFFAPHEERKRHYPAPKDLAPIVFVGRSNFPGKAQFFSGVDIERSLLDDAEKLLKQGARPDLLWWENQLGLQDASYWPGKQARQAALGAEESSLFWRQYMLLQAARAGAILCGTAAKQMTYLDIIGDQGWATCLPEGARLLAPVDYYARLPQIYEQARYSLVLTSLQLPHGLNQRHFDVWMAGGCALSDATTGLALFPEELVRPIRIAKAEEIATVINTLEASPGGGSALRHDWQQLLMEQHTYTHRMADVLRCVH